MTYDVNECWYPNADGTWDYCVWYDTDTFVPDFNNGSYMNIVYNADKPLSYGCCNSEKSCKRENCNNLARY